MELVFWKALEDVSSRCFNAATFFWSSFKPLLHLVCVRVFVSHEKHHNECMRALDGCYTIIYNQNVVSYSFNIYSHLEVNLFILVQ